MELEILRTIGIPESGIISIRTGGTRRQAQISSLEGPLKFPNRLETSATFKIDVLDLLGSARLAYNPEEQEYNLPLESACEGGDTKHMEVTLAIKRAGDAAGDGADLEPENSNAWRHRKELAARDYLEEHGLVTFMQFLMQSLMKDKPADPYAFLQKQLALRVSRQRGDVNSGPPPPEVPSRDAGSERRSNEDSGLDALLAKLAPEASVVPSDQLAELEREASMAGDRLRGDNQRLRETAEQLKSDYKRLLDESTSLQQQAPDPVPAPVASLAAAQAEPAYEAPRPADPVASEAVTGAATSALLSSMAMPHCESLQVAAYKDIARMQDEVAALAKENAILVAELVQTRSSIDSVRNEIGGLRP